VIAQFTQDDKEKPAAMLIAVENVQPITFMEFMLEVTQWLSGILPQMIPTTRAHDHMMMFHISSELTAHLGDNLRMK
jgi:hypothetical protein